MNKQTILGIAIILIVAFVIFLYLIFKPKKPKMKSPKQLREMYSDNNTAPFYSNYKLTQKQAEYDVNKEYKGFITRPV